MVDFRKYCSVLFFFRNEKGEGFMMHYERPQYVDDNTLTEEAKINAKDMVKKKLKLNGAKELRAIAIARSEMQHKDIMNKSRKGFSGMEDYIINKAEAKIYKDINKHELLNIPILKNEKETGAIYEVLSVGNSGVNLDPIITVKESNGSAVAYRLPHDLVEWVDYQRGLSLQGIKMFPAKIEFGSLNNRIYAEIL